MRATAHRQPADQEAEASRGRAGTPATAAEPARPAAEPAHLGPVSLLAGGLPAAALRGLQRQVGNRATAHRLQRAPVAAKGSGMSGSGPVSEDAAAEPAAAAGAERQVYAVNFGGQTYRIASHELPALLQHVGQDLWLGPVAEADAAYAEIHSEYHVLMSQFQDQPVVASIIKAVGQAEFPHQEMAAADAAMHEARAAVMGLIRAPSLQGARSAREALLRARALIFSAHAGLKIFKMRMVLGGEATVHSLEFTRDYCFTLAGALAAAALVPAAGAGAAGAAGVAETTSGAAGIGTSIATGAGVEGAAALTKGLATAGGHQLAGTAKPLGETGKELAYAVAKGAVLGGVGGLVKPVGDAMSAKVAAQLAKGLPEPVAKQLAEQVVNNLISGMISVPVDIVEHVLQSDGPVSCQELVDYLAEQAKLRAQDETIKSLAPMIETALPH